ncbi:hypothetical protein HALA3H3_620035 [Halomonas sp. A3H3]|nr:hypothetical protein HALA3H3_620035 [Halomonas sp. A3H3]
MIHGSTESYAVDDSRIITDGSDFFRASLTLVRLIRDDLIKDDSRFYDERCDSIVV